MLEKLKAYFLPNPSHRPIFDWMRVFACIGIIGTHVTSDRSDPMGITFQNTFVLALPMFFLLSGVLFLTRKKEEPLGAFYLKRFESVVLPFFIYGAYYTCWINQGHAILERPTAESLGNAFRLIPLSWQQTFEGLQYFHLWFMYEIIGLYLVMPFLKKGLQAMSEKMLKALFFIILLLMGLQSYLPAFGHALTITNYFAYWILYLIIGYILMQDFARKSYLWIALVGFVMYVSTLRLEFRHYEFSQRIQFLHDLAPHMILQVAGLFAFCMLLEPLINRLKIVNIVISRLARYTLGVYLIHGYIVSWWSFSYGTSSGTIQGTFHTLFWVTLLSFAFALVFDNLITFNLQRLFRLIVNAVRSRRQSAHE